MEVNRRRFLVATGSIALSTGCLSDPQDNAEGTAENTTKTTNPTADQQNTTTRVTRSPSPTETTESTTTTFVKDPNSDLAVYNRYNETIEISIQATDMNDNTKIYDQTHTINSFEEILVEELVTDTGTYKFIAELSDGQRSEIEWSPQSDREAMNQGVRFYITKEGELGSSVQ